MDKVTELQLLLDQLGEQLFNTVGLIQLRAPPNPFGYAASLPPQASPEIDAKWLQENAALVVATSKKIQEKIDELPGIETTEEAQLNQLEDLEAENAKLEALISAKIDEAKELKDAVNSGLQQLARDKIDSLK